LLAIAGEPSVSVSETSSPPCTVGRASACGLYCQVEGEDSLRRGLLGVYRVRNGRDLDFGGLFHDAGRGAYDLKLLWTNTQ
jgi:hypothetical protein